MTTDETTAPLWVPERDYLPREDRSVIRSLRPVQGVGSFDDFVTTAAAPNSWNVVVGPGRAIVDGTTNPWTQGSYALYAPTSRQLPVQPAHPTLRRYDLVVLHVFDQENSTEQGFRWRREVITGTPGSGVPPNLPPNSRPIRGLDIAPASGAVTPSSLITFWPYWHNSDLRRPVSWELMMIHDHKNRWQNYNLANEEWYRPFWFDLQVPVPWRQLALWPFETVVKVEIDLHFRAFYSYQTIDAWYWSPSRPSAGWIWEISNVWESQMVHMAFSDTFKANPGEAPWWDFYLVPRWTHYWDFDGVARTTITPRGPTTHRVGNGGAEF
ncbi:MAG: hypothetical protein LBJ87_05575 [bacterium]|jgi:hypothetical protein|nr:hypothetical protein [bacterium]